MNDCKDGLEDTAQRIMINRSQILFNMKGGGHD
jgi:hypothetical protein